MAMFFKDKAIRDFDKESINMTSKGEKDTKTKDKKKGGAQASPRV